MSKSLQRQIIEQARNLIADKDKWTQGALARDEDNHDLLSPTDMGAVKFCAIGAVRYIGAQMGVMDTTAAERHLALVVEPDNTDILSFDGDECESIVGPENDGDIAHAHDDVLAMFDLALEETV